MRTLSASLATTFALVAPAADARQCQVPPSPTAPSTAQYTIEDVTHTLPKWVPLDAPNGLGVKAADFNADGELDLVIGGNGPKPVQVFYLEANLSNQIYPAHVELLDPLVVGGHIFTNTSGCYGVDVADLDHDGLPDLVVGRRKGNEGFSVDGYRDTVWLNDGTGLDRFDGIPPKLLPVVGEDTTYVMGQDKPYSETFGLGLQHLNGDLHHDLITVGAFGIRQYTGDGLGNFTHVTTYTEAGTSGVYRNVEFGDLDQDGLVDLFVCRAGSASDRAWLNIGTPTAPVFMVASGSSHPVILRPPGSAVQWRIGATGGCGLPPSCGVLGATEVGTIDIDLHDLDGDGDLDLVIACPNAKNAAYLNDGNGAFGSRNTLPNGRPTWVFETATPDWPDDVGGFAYSEFLYQAAVAAGAFNVNTPKSCVDFRVDGLMLEFASSPWIDDFDGDGILDVAFANRNDLHEVCLMNPFVPKLPGGSGPYLGFPYLSDTIPAPPVYDHIHFGAPAVGGISFRPCVELVGRANDGTSYLETAFIDSDGVLDWIESNFSNNFFSDDLGNDYEDVSNSTHVWFGQTPPAGTDCP